MKRIGIVVILLCAFSLFANAQSMKNLFLNMPDSLVSYLDKNKRQEMVDYAEIHHSTGVANLLGGNSVIDSLSNDYLKASLTASTDLEMLVFPVKDDSIICVVKTYKVNDGVSLDSTSSYIKESRVELYSHDWNRPIRILNESYMNPMEISKASRTVLEGEGRAKNAFGSAEARESSTVKSIASRRKLDDFAPVFWEMKIDPSKKVLVYNANCPMLTQEEKKRLKEENKLTEFNYEVNLLNIF